MRHSTQMFSSLFLSALLVISIILPISAQSRVSAKIGIQIRSSGKVFRAKAKHRITSDDKLRIYVLPEEDSFVYFFHTDKKMVNLLHIESYKGHTKKKNPIILPIHKNESYQFDGTSQTESFIIVCSPFEISEVSELLSSGNIPYSEWNVLEKKLSRKSNIDISDTGEDPISIAGNVRSLEDPFLKMMPTFSGESLLIKKYEFKVRK